MLNFALVGCGRISARHAQLLGGGKIAGARLKCVCDINIEKAKLLGEEYSVPYFQNMHEMMESAEVDVVVVLTESGNHAAHTIQLAKYGKHIVVEKPMALSLKDADDMIEACESAGVKLFVVKQNRFNSPVVKLREALDSGRFGRINYGTIRVRWCRDELYYKQAPWRGTWKLDGGVLANQASHHLDLLEWMLGKPVSVYSTSRRFLADIEAEDTSIAIVKFESGAIGLIEATTATRPRDLEGSISILGEKGTVVIEGFAVNELKTWQFRDVIDSDTDIQKYSVNPPNVYGFGHKEYYDSVINCLLNNQPASVDGYEGRKSLELITALYESQETGQEVLVGSPYKHCRLGLQTL